METLKDQIDKIENLLNQQRDLINDMKFGRVNTKHERRKWVGEMESNLLRLGILKQYLKAYVKEDDE